MSTHAQLLLEIERFLLTHGLAPTTFGRKAVNDVKFVANLRNGGDVTTRTLDRVRAFMRDYEGKGRPRRRNSECARVA